MGVCEKVVVVYLCYKYVVYIVVYGTAPPRRVGDPVGLMRLNGRLPRVARIGIRAGAMRGSSPPLRSSFAAYYTLCPRSEKQS